MIIKKTNNYPSELDEPGNGAGHDSSTSGLIGAFKQYAGKQ